MSPDVQTPAVPSSTPTAAPSSNGRRNRGPAAAPANRKAVLDAARRLFADRGYHVPLSAIAAEAGVGQGVLYRHFPTRLDLAFTVFEEHLDELDLIAADPAPGTFARLWDRLVELTVEETAFVEMVVDARREHREYDGVERLRTLLAGPLDRARTAGTVDPGTDVETVLVAQRMVFGVAVTAAGTDQAYAAARHAERVVGLHR
ncbi:MAG TPA: helix-turn-helix domain-containing protein [Cellulomonas sp.]